MGDQDGSEEGSKFKADEDDSYQDEAAIPEAKSKFKDEQDDTDTDTDNAGDDPDND